MSKVKVLFFAANPRGTVPLDLPREFRKIDEEVRLGPFRDAVDLILVPGTRPVDLFRKLNELQPHVVHFSSHGNPDEIVLESGDEDADPPGVSATGLRSADERDMKSVPQDAVESGSTGQDQPRLLSKSALVDVLRSCNEGNLRLVVLNACHTRSQSQALTEVVDCVVGMNRSISDKAAIMFAASFYGALAYGRSIRRAFEQGVARLRAEGIAEVDTPELLVRASVDPSNVVLVGSAPRQVSEAPFIMPSTGRATYEQTKFEVKTPPPWRLTALGISPRKWLIVSMIAFIGFVVSQYIYKYIMRRPPSNSNSVALQIPFSTVPDNNAAAKQDQGGPSPQDHFVGQLGQQSVLSGPDLDSATRGNLIEGITDRIVSVIGGKNFKKQQFADILRFCVFNEFESRGYQLTAPGIENYDGTKTRLFEDCERLAQTLVDEHLVSFDNLGWNVPEPIFGPQILLGKHLTYIVEDAWRLATGQRDRAGRGFGAIQKKAESSRPDPR
jgi:CHAT domain